MCKCNRLNEVAQYKTACRWSLLLLYNTVVDGALWVGKRRVGCLVKSAQGGEPRNEGRVPQSDKT